MAAQTPVNSIANYFRTPVDVNRDGKGEKRTYPSSAESSSSSSVGATPACKKTLVLNSSSIDSSPNNISFESTQDSPDSSKNKMSNNQISLESLKEMIEGIQSKLSNVATKEDIAKVSDECNKVYERLDSLTKKVEDSIARFEGRVYDVEKKMDQVIEENKTLKAENAELFDKINKQHKDLNDLQQYSRRRNLRIFNLKGSPKESAVETEKKVCDTITDILKVKITPEMIDACHRVPWAGDPPKSKDGKTRSQDIIVQFKSRKDRDVVFAVKSRCKNQGFSLGEDLTAENAKLCLAVHKHKGFTASWSSSGKIKGKLANNKTLTIPLGANLDELVQKNT